VTDKRSTDHQPWNAGVWEQQQFDAFGRRLTRVSIPASDCTALDCRSVVNRYVWDGDNLLYEIRYPITSADQERGTIATDTGHYGRIMYTNAGTIDRPLTAVRIDYGPTAFFGAPVRFKPHWNWRGTVTTGTFDDGLTYHCLPPVNGLLAVDPQHCFWMGWQGDVMNWWLGLPHLPVAPTWMGSIIRDQADASGLMLMRNRYYDPEQGRFTQEDPLSVFGGINTYGYAAGDPASFSDPFGLKVCFESDDPLEIEYLKHQLEIATSSKIKLDAGGKCIKTTADGVQEAPGGNANKAFLRRRLQTLAKKKDRENRIQMGDVTITIGSGRDSYTTINPKSLGPYATQGKNASCIETDPNAQLTMPAVLTHELLGHAFNGETTNPSQDEWDAIAIENQYHQSTPKEPDRFALNCKNGKQNFDPYLP
jgi:RHS repeat-associated protein